MKTEELLEIVANRANALRDLCFEATAYGLDPNHYVTKLYDYPAGDQQAWYQALAEVRRQMDIDRSSHGNDKNSA